VQRPKERYHDRGERDNHSASRDADLHRPQSERAAPGDAAPEACLDADHVHSRPGEWPTRDAEPYERRRSVEAGFLRRAGRDAGFLPAYPDYDWGDLICW